MTHAEAKAILLTYRPGTTDAEDPQVAEALALARNDTELARWLDEHCARHEILRAKFRQITPPEGLREQIISERAVQINLARKQRTLALAAIAAIVLILGLVAVWWHPQHAGNTFTHYCNRMVGTALRGYSMDLETNSLEQIRTYLARHQAPANYQLPDGLQKTIGVGCAVLTWQGTKVSMVCFRTGKSLMPGQQSDLWLFVVDSDSVKGGPTSSSPRFTRMNQLITASWTQGGKLYLLGTTGDEQTIRRYL